MSGGYQKIAVEEENSETQLAENNKTTSEKLSVSHDVPVSYTVELFSAVLNADNSLSYRYLR